MKFFLLGPFLLAVALYIVSFALLFYLCEAFTVEAKVATLGFLVAPHVIALIAAPLLEAYYTKVAETLD